MKLTAISIRGPVSVLAFGLAVLLCWSGSLFADYTIVLKSGGRVTIERYWEEREMVKFYGFGGVIGIARQQIQSILRAREGEQQGMVLAAIEKSQVKREVKETVLAAEGNPAQLAASAREGASTKVRRFRGKDQEQEEHQTLVKGLTEGIKSRTELHWLITRGTSDPAPTLLNTLEALNGRIDDLNSRLKNAQHDPARFSGTGVVRMVTNSPFAGRKMWLELRPTGVIRPGRVNVRRVHAARAGVSLPGYTLSERELGQLTNELILLYKERKKLIQRMEQSDLFTGSLPFE